VQAEERRAVRGGLGAVALLIGAAFIRLWGIHRFQGMGARGREKVKE
jgi:hypothetical protein